MKRKKIIALVITFIIILAASYFYAYVQRDIKIYDSKYDKSELVQGIMINSDNNLELEFVCDKANLTGIKAMLTCAGAKTGVIKYTVFDGAGNAVAETETKKLSSFKDGKFTSLGFETIKDSLGKQYKLVISCENDAQNSAIVFMEPDEEPIPGISYVYTKWDLETMICMSICLMYLVFFSTTLVRIFRK